MVTFILFSVSIFTLLIFLGTWQIQRLEWKNKLVADITASTKQPPVYLSSDLIAAILDKGSDFDYKRVRVEGTIENTRHKFSLMSKMRNDKIGYHLVLPLTLKNGGMLIVDLGWVPDKKDLSQIALPSGEISFTGYLKQTDQAGSFTPENDYDKNQLFTISPIEIAKEKGWAALLPFYVTRTSKEPLLEEYPTAIDSVINIRNLHLQYAVTWYLLALIWSFMSFLFIRKQLKAPLQKV